MDNVITLTSIARHRERTARGWPPYLQEWARKRQLDRGQVPEVVGEPAPGRMLLAEVGLDAAGSTDDSGTRRNGRDALPFTDFERAESRYWSRFPTMEQPGPLVRSSRNGTHFGAPSTLRVCLKPACRRTAIGFDYCLAHHPSASGMSQYITTDRYHQ